jgi:hypothetical protein
MANYPPPHGYPSYGQHPPPQKSGASGVFWGLVLFFIVLPIAIFGITCAACGAGCLGLSAVGHSVTKDEERKAAAEKAEREKETEEAAARARLANLPEAGAATPQLER